MGGVGVVSVLANRGVGRGAGIELAQGTHSRQVVMALSVVALVMNA